MSDASKKPRILTVNLTVTGAPQHRTNKNGKPFLSIRGTSGSGTTVSLQTYRQDMIDLLSPLAEGSNIKLRGCFEFIGRNRIFSPMFQYEPKQKAAAAA